MKTKVFYKLLLLTALFFCEPKVFGQNSPKESPNIIFITFDGVRPEEIFTCPDPYHCKLDTAPLFPFLNRELFPKGMLLGRNKNFRVGNASRISLPGYFNMMAGSPTDCNTNRCDRITTETLPLRLMREWNWTREQAAVFASWQRIEYAAENEENRLFHNAGKTPYLPQPLPPEIDELNKQQETEKHNGLNARNDHFTFKFGFHYLKTKRPKFLWLSFNESDYHAHLNRYDRHAQALRKYDAWIQQMVEWLQQDTAYSRNTYIFMTTDHGRGYKNQWKRHLARIEGAQYVWFFAGKIGAKEVSPEIPFEADRFQYNQIDIRPTIEALLGLKPRSCDGCGKPIEAVLKNVPAN